MGVLACDRKNCESIMCNRYSFNYGYICNDCFDELKQMGVNTDIAYFMRSNKKQAHNAVDADLFFGQEFELI